MFCKGVKGQYKTVKGVGTSLHQFAKREVLNSDFSLLLAVDSFWKQRRRNNSKNAKMYGVPVI